MDYILARVTIYPKTKSFVFRISIRTHWTFSYQDQKQHPGQIEQSTQAIVTASAGSLFEPIRTLYKGSMDFILARVTTYLKT